MQIQPIFNQSQTDTWHLVIFVHPQLQTQRTILPYTMQTSIVTLDNNISEISTSNIWNFKNFGKHLGHIPSSSKEWNFYLHLIRFYSTTLSSFKLKSSLSQRKVRNHRALPTSFAVHLAVLTTDDAHYLSHNVNGSKNFKFFCGG